MSKNIVLPRYDPKKPKRIIYLNRGRDGVQWLEEAGESQGTVNRNRFGGVSGRIVLADAGIVRGGMQRIGVPGRVKIVGRGIEPKGKSEERAKTSSVEETAKVYGIVEPITEETKAEGTDGNEGSVSKGEQTIRAEGMSGLEKDEWEEINREIGAMCDRQNVNDEAIKEWVIKAGLEKAKERAEYLRSHGSGREGFVERLEGIIAKEELERAKEERLAKYKGVAEDEASKQESKSGAEKEKRGKKKKGKVELTQRAEVEGDGNGLPLPFEQEKIS